MQNVFKILFILLIPTLIHAHVGSPDTYYEGDAGPYHLFVAVRLPSAISGQGEIQVCSRSSGVHRVQIVLLDLTGPGSTLSPALEVAQRSKVDPQCFSSSLWFLQFGALQMRIQAD